jgi:hypothetical protein
MQALLRYPKRQRSAKAREWGARGNASQAVARLTRDLPWETIVARARDDERGKLTRHGCTYFGDGRIVHWEIRRSIAGRHNQFDVIADGILVRTYGQRRLQSWLRMVPPIKAPSPAAQRAA